MRKFSGFTRLLRAGCFLSLLGVLSCASRLIPSRRHGDPRPLCACGSNAKPMGTRVVGGHNALRGQFPYATALLPGSAYYIYSLRTGLPMMPPYCGGTLITDRHVVTAAHCVRGRQPPDISVDVSEFDISNAHPEPQERQIRKTSRLLMHPQHRKIGFLNDIAIIELSRPVTLGSKMRTAWLPSHGVQLTPGTTVTVYGWGRLEYRGTSPNVLQTLDIPVVDHDNCQYGYSTRIRENMMLCAGGEKGKDACIGDSGSGLVTRLSNENVLVGVVSFGKECALPDTPGIYTKVSSYVDWIYKSTLNAGCQPCIAARKNFK